jgi:IS605 OrfB family transposase
VAHVRVVLVGRQLRSISDPVVLGAPTGVRIRTRLHLDDAEVAILDTIGGFLGSLYRRELAARVRLGDLDRSGHGAWRAERKQALTWVSSSRWAGAITRAVENQYQLAMRGLGSHVLELRSVIAVLETRCALRPGELLAPEGSHIPPVRGYLSAATRFDKTRQLASLRRRLSAAEEALSTGRPVIAVGGSRLWRSRHRPDEVGCDGVQWRQHWDAARLFLMVDGESGKVGGNETIRLDSKTGRLRIKVPSALVGRFGTHLDLAEPVLFNYRRQEWASRVAGRRAVRYDIIFDSKRGRWYLDASWTVDADPPTKLDDLRFGFVLGVDLNAGHLAVCVLDASGNPIGEPRTIAVNTEGMRASRRDGRVRAAITAMLDLATQYACRAVVVEDLDFRKFRATAGETLAFGQRSKRLRRSVAGIPTAKFRARLTSMATRRGIAVIAVDPAYTSRWGSQHWRRPLQEQTSDPSAVTVHHGAAVAIGRRGLGKSIRRRPAGPRTQQRMSVGTPPSRPGHKPRYPLGDADCSGSPARPKRRAMSVHRITPITADQDRSGCAGALVIPDLS